MNFKLPLLVFMLVFSCSGKKEESKTEAKSEIANTSDVSSIKSNEVDFISVKLLGGKIDVSMPRQLQTMDKHMFALKYPNENQNTTIAYSNEDGTISLLISPRQDKATQADLPKYQRMLYESFGKNPFIEFKKSDIEKINGKNFIVLEMITPAVDTQVYNMMFATSSDGKLLIGTFNCTLDKMKEWKPVAEKIVSSVSIRE